MTTRAYLPLIALLGGCATQWAAGSRQRAPLFSDRTKPRVDVILNGQGPFLFLVDTGAGGCMISERVAARLQLALGRAGRIVGVGGVEHARAVVIDSVSVGGVEARHVPFAVTRDRPNEGEETDGLLGYPFLKSYRVIFDYPETRVTFERGDLNGSPQGGDAGTNQRP